MGTCLGGHCWKEHIFSPNWSVIVSIPTHWVLSIDTSIRRQMTSATIIAHIRNLLPPIELWTTVRGLAKRGANQTLPCFPKIVTRVQKWPKKAHKNMFWLLTTTSKPKIVRSSLLLSQVAAFLTSSRSRASSPNWFFSAVGRDFKLWKTMTRSMVENQIFTCKFEARKNKGITKRVPVKD